MSFNDALNLTFNGVNIPSFVRVTNINYSILPNMNATQAYTQFTGREITLEFIFLFDKLKKQEDLIRFSDWLKGNNFNPSKLQLPGDEFHYLAKVTNAVNVTGTMKQPSGSITFTCYDEYRIGNEQKTVGFTNTTTITYGGNAPTYPIIKITLTAATSTGLKLAFENTKQKNFVELSGSFNSGDVINIDMKRTKITKGTDKPALILNMLTLDSNFHTLAQGTNKYTLTGASANVEIKYNEQYL